MKVLVSLVLLSLCSLKSFAQPASMSVRGHNNDGTISREAAAFECEETLKVIDKRFKISVEGCSAMDVGLQVSCMSAIKDEIIHSRQTTLSFVKKLCAIPQTIMKAHTEVARDNREANCYLRSKTFFEKGTSEGDAYQKVLEECKPKQSDYSTKWAHDRLKCLREGFAKIE